MKIIDCEQRSPEWFAARAGKPTASEFSTVLAKGKGNAESKTRRTYLLKLAGEILTGEPMEGFSNVHLERGREMEPEARDYYAFLASDPIQQVGFIDCDTYGCSPDALVGTDGVLEIKTALPHLLIGYHLDGGFPSEHKAQCQGALWVTGRKWVDLLIYWPRIEPYVVRAERDEPYIAGLAAEVGQFNTELAGVVETMRALGARKAA